MLIPLASTIGVKEGRVKESDNLNSIELVYLTKHAVLNVTGNLGMPAHLLLIQWNHVIFSFSSPRTGSAVC
jgi:hypothetical protein